MMSTKDHLLSNLKERKGNWVSGESLSRTIAVSRSAIWKNICKLREEGYVIKSSPKKGYLLYKNSEMLLPHEIREGLETKVLGKREIVHYRETDSTNKMAKDLAARDALEGTLVISEKQTKGRGRKGRAWFSPPQEGIYISLILRPTISPVEAPKITMLTGVAVAEALLSLTELEINIKWPNDILVNGKKIGGILTELSTEMDVVNYIVVGLGLNVNTPSFPDDLGAKATSIFIETGKHFPRALITREYLKWYERYYEIFKGTGFGPLIRRWKELTDMIGRQIIVDLIGRQCRGRVLDIDDDGVLIVEDNKGKSHRIFYGDVTLL